MILKNGESGSFADDPLLILLALECDPDDEQQKQEFEAIAAERTSVLLAAQAYTAIRQSQSN